MARFVVLLSIPGLRARDLSAMPNLSRLFVGGGNAILVPSFPAVTCPGQANMTTGYPPRQNGAVANGLDSRGQRRGHVAGHLSVRSKRSRTIVCSPAPPDALTSSVL